MNHKLGVNGTSISYFHIPLYFEYLKLLHDNIHGNEQKEYYIALAGLMHKMYAKKGAGSFEADANSAVVLPWNDPTILGAWHDNPVCYRVTFEDDGKIHVKHWRSPSTAQLSMMTPNNPAAYHMASNFDYEEIGTMEFDPFDMVCINFLSNEAHANKMAGDNYLVPAVFLLDFAEKQEKQMLQQTRDLALFAIGLMFGASEIAAASAIWQVIAVADMIVTAGDLIINQLRNQIMELDGGPEFLKVWDIFNTAYMIFGLGQLLYNTPEIIRNLKGLLSRRIIDAVGDEGRKLDDQLAALERLIDQSDAHPELKAVLSELDEAKRSGAISNVDELDNWLDNHIPENQRQLFDQETVRLLNDFDNVDVSVIRIQRNAEEVRFRLSDPQLSDGKYAKIPQSHMDKADSIIDDIAAMDDVRRQRALEIIDTRYRNKKCTMQDHHWITQSLAKNKGYWFLDQQYCGMDLITDRRNLSMIAGHSGRHPKIVDESFNNVLIDKLDDLLDDIDDGIEYAKIPNRVSTIINDMKTGVAKGDILLHNFDHDDFIILENIVGNGLIH